MAQDYSTWGYAGSGYGERVYLEVWYSSNNPAGNYTTFGYKIWNFSNNSYGDTGSISWRISDPWNSSRASGSRADTPTTGYNQTRDYASGYFNIQNYDNGSMGNVGFTLHISRNLGNIKSTTVSVTVNAPTINRTGYISSAPSNFIINSGFAVTPTARSNGLSYDVAIYDAAGNTALVGYKAVTAGKSNSFSFNATEMNTLYNYLTAEGGTNVRIYLRTKSGSTNIGYDYKTVLVKPKALSYTAPSSFTVGTNFNVSVTPNATALTHHTGLVINGSWVTGFPINMAANQTTQAISTNTDAQKKAIMAVDTSKNSFTIQLYMRQYNAKGVILGLVIKDITANIPNITSTQSAVAGILRGSVTVKLSGNITTVDSLAYSLNGGAFIGLTSAPGSSYTHTLTGLASNTQQRVQYRYKQTGTNYYYYSSVLTFNTLAESGLTISPTTIYVDDVLKVDTTNASTAVTNRLYFKRTTDNVEFYRNNNHPAGTFNRTFTDADFNNGDSFNGRESVTVRVYLDMMTSGVVEKTISRDVIVFPNGVMYVKEGGAWKRAYVQAKESNVQKRAIPHVRVNNAWQKAKS